MRFATAIRPAVTGLLLVAVAYGTAAAQAGTGPIVMRSENSSLLQVFMVDAESGVAAFYGGDLVAICRDEPDAHDLLDIQVVYEPQEIARVFNLQGQDIGGSLWDPAPPLDGSRLCRDILSRGPPMATGTADIRGSGRFPQTWGDPDVTSVYGVTATGTMRTPEGETLRVNAYWRCRGRVGERQSQCAQGVVVNR